MYLNYEILYKYRKLELHIFFVILLYGKIRDLTVR